MNPLASLFVAEVLSFLSNESHVRCWSRTMMGLMGGKWLVLVALSVGLAGCSSTKDMASVVKEAAKADEAREAANEARLKRKTAQLQERVDAMPKWAMEPVRSDSVGVYAVGMADSDKLQIALQKATLQAEFGLAKRYRQELSGSERMGTMDRGERAVQDSYTQLIDKLVANVPMNGAEVIEQEIKIVRGQFTAWVLMRVSFDQMAKMAHAESGAASDERMRAAFADLERRVRERQEEQLKLEERRQDMRLKEMRATKALEPGEERKVDESKAASDGEQKAGN